MRLLTIPFLLAATGAHADACADALAAFKAGLGGDKRAVLSAAQTLRGAQVCNDATVTRAMQQASAVLARKAQGLVAAGDLDGASAMLDGAPGLHWAVQTVRADIAAARGQRAEAAQLYNAALDTITDPALTPPDERLAPVADRIARLAQENMMLAGTLSSSVTRGGGASGVLKSAVRGIVIEKVPAPKPAPSATPAPTPDYSETPAPKPVPDPYATGKKEDYVVADHVAKATKTVFLPIRFAFNSDQLDASGIHEALTLAAFLNANGIRRITLQGHTDEIGSEAFNFDLSLRRAITVRDFLVAQGVTAWIEVQGFGETRPPELVDAAIYDDEERRAIARRVELVLHG